ncbi:glycoside hydrolase family 65 protein [Coniochaeta ligniaria NRRL 30616]|uniref:alpha,alpha-trehalase n=1 Tax=Coniochaeta ligniaria NRRL 30616 TaxID=1408157 RepID=A0A1J7JJM8_9PEZI|nr:glycoside hydrolase family 65 protein [Coniochaeta ligniaria NRRL 30616]
MPFEIHGSEDVSLLRRDIGSFDHDASGSSGDADSWTLSTDTFTANHYQSSAYVANGYFGQRLPAEGVGYWIYRDDSNGGYLQNSWPLDQPRATFGTISGFWDVQQNITHTILPGNLLRGGESVISGIPDWTALTLTTDKGHTYQPGVDIATVKGFHQSLSLRNGIVHTNITWSPPDDTAHYQLNYTVVAHRTRLNLGIVRLDISVNQSVALKVTDILDGAGAVRATFNDKAFEDEDIIWTSVKPWGIDYCTAYLASTVRFGSSNEDGGKAVSISSHDGSQYPWVSANSSTVAQTWDWTLGPGDTLSVYKFVGIASTTAFPDRTLSVVKSAAKSASKALWDELLLEHTVKWDATWDDADIIVPGDQDLQLRARASLYHTLASLLPDDTGLANNSITVGGLSSDSYAGLIFWDADTWIYPAVLALHPQYSVGINNYRERLLNQAVENAQYYNYSGALYAWTSGRFGNCTGTGVCKGYQYHLNTDIALAHWQYFLQTNNLAWLAEKGWPVIKSVADMFAAYVSYNASSGQYATIQLGEPDEFAYNINNGAFTNVAIKQLLGTWAPSAAKHLGLQVPQNWTDIAKNMYIPYSQDEEIIIEFDGMDGTWEVKQASVGLINYPLEFQLSETQARNDVAYYSSVNTADGPAMTWSIYAISEAQLQQKGCAAYTYLQRASEPYIRQPFFQFSETLSDSALPGVSNPAFIFGLNPAFPFLTGAGGFLQVFTHGLTGMRFDLDAFTLDPVLPPQLAEGVCVRGMKWQCAVFDVAIGMENTTVTRRADQKDCAGARQVVTVRVLLVGESLVVPTRRPDISSSLNDLALCKHVTSDDNWAPGNYPYAIVDGSNSTIWQPASPDESSSVIDLSAARRISKVVIDWAAVPPAMFSLSGSREPGAEFEELSPSHPVEISAPFNAEEARQVRIRVGNTTEVVLSQPNQVRFLKLTMHGSHASDGLGATVAEVHVIGLGDDDGIYGEHVEKNASMFMDELW